MKKVKLAISSGKAAMRAATPRVSSSSLRGVPTKSYQVEEELTESILHGRIVPGERLAPIQDLARSFGVSRTIIHRTLRRMADAGLVRSMGPHGYYVNSVNRVVAPGGASVVPSAPVAVAPPPFPVAEAEGPRPTEKTETETADETPDAPTPEGRVFLSCGHHFDLVWQCTYEEYAGMREEPFAQLLDLMERHPEMHAFVEQAESLRVQLERHPEQLEAFRRFHREGRLALLGGLLIADTNLCWGELWVRNFREGRRFYGETFGHAPEIACLDDCFGMAEQLPQLLRQAGYRYALPGNQPATGLDPRQPFRWVGPDGSAIVVTPFTRRIDHVIHCCNAPVIQDDLERLRESLADLAAEDFPGDALAVYMNEIDRIREAIFPLLDGVNREESGRRIEFGSIEDYCRRLSVAALPEVRGELNPRFTGAYTSRISVKRAMRRLENEMFLAEMALRSPSTAAWSRLQSAWQALHEISFHDAITGCCADYAQPSVRERIDAAGRDLRDLLREAFADNAPTPETGTATTPGQALRIINPSQDAGATLVAFDAEEDWTVGDAPVQRVGPTLYTVLTLPACGCAERPLGRGPAAAALPAGDRFETEHFTVDVSSPYPRVTARKVPGAVFAADGFGELLIRLEVGSLWNERLHGPWLGREQQDERVVLAESGAVFHRLVTEGRVRPEGLADDPKHPGWVGFERLTFRKEYRFYRGLDYFTLKLTLDWRGRNNKIAIRFPTAVNPHDATALYATPWGATPRQPYYEVPKAYRDTLCELHPGDTLYATGDWPALHWVDYTDNRVGLAVANTGTPAHQLTAGAVLVGLLRSGATLVDGSIEPGVDSFEPGIHEYEFAFRPHTVTDTDAAPALGRVLNRAPAARVVPDAGGREVSWFSLAGGTLEVGSLRWTPEGLVARLVELRGRRVTARLASGLGTFRLYESNILERDWSFRPGAEIQFSPFEVKTLRLSFG